MDEIVRVCQLDQYFTADDHVYMKEALDTRLRAISEESADVVTEEAVAALKALAKKVNLLTSQQPSEILQPLMMSKETQPWERKITFLY